MLLQQQQNDTLNTCYCVIVLLQQQQNDTFKTTRTRTKEQSTHNFYSMRNNSIILLLLLFLLLLCNFVVATLDIRNNKNKKINLHTFSVQLSITQLRRQITGRHASARCTPVEASSGQEQYYIRSA